MGAWRGITQRALSARPAIDLWMHVCWMMTSSLRKLQEVGLGGKFLCFTSRKRHHWILGSAHWSLVVWKQPPPSSSPSLLEQNNFLKWLKIHIKQERNGSD